MKSSGPETPVAASLRLAKNFTAQPEESGKKLAELGRLEGYHTIVPAVNTLWDACVRQEEREILAFLRQPEWEWRQWADDPTVHVAGLVRADDGTFVPVGIYPTGEAEDGTFTTLDLEGDGEALSYLPGKVPDPRPKVKPRLYRKNRKYFLVLVGQAKELLRAGYKQAQIIMTKGKGYLGNHEAYVVREGPLDATKAQEEKLTHFVRPRQI